MRLLALLLIFVHSYAGPTLQSFLSQGKNGDYIVTRNGKLFTLIHLKSLDEQSLVFEEISSPEQRAWADWVKQKAPGHTSWTQIEIDLKTGQVLDCYSFTKNVHLQLSKNESFLATLLQLPLTEVSDANRRRIGSPPNPGEPDFRKIWNPKLTFEGALASGILCDAYETNLPEDSSEIGGRRVTLYFDHERKIPFPCWVDIETSHITGRFYVIDSGKNLQSPYTNHGK